MNDKYVNQIKQEIWQEYLDRTPGSQAHNQKAKESMPGGDTRSIGFFQPYPFFVARGEGCRLHDVDGNAYVDFVNPMPGLAADDLPTSQPTKGVPSCVAGDIRVVPFNDLGAMERVLEQEKGKTAAIIMEPMLGAGGGVAPGGSVPWWRLHCSEE